MAGGKLIIRTSGKGVAFRQFDDLDVEKLAQVGTHFKSLKSEGRAEGREPSGRRVLAIRASQATNQP